jgi:uncharacterized Zn-finger protein
MYEVHDKDCPRREEFAPKEIDHDDTETPVCPECGKEYNADLDMDDGDEDEICCPKCETQYKVTAAVYTTWYYTTEIIKEEETP